MTSITLVGDAELRALFQERLNLLVEDADEDLMASGLVDSLSLVDLLFQLEQQYDVVIDLETLDLEDFQSLTRIAAWVNNQRGN